MEKVLRRAFPIQHLEMINESQKHSSHYMGEGDTHWTFVIVSSAFTGLNRIQRHQRINDLFRSEFEQGLHALSLKLYSNDEWAATPSPK